MDSCDKDRYDKVMGVLDKFDVEEIEGDSKSAEGS